MEMSRAGTGAGNADMQHAALQPDSEIASDNANTMTPTLIAKGNAI